MCIIMETSILEFGEKIRSYKALIYFKMGIVLKGLSKKENKEKALTTILMEIFIKDNG